MLRTSAIDGKGKGKLSTDISSVKSEQSKFKWTKVKKELPLSKIEVRSRCLFGLSNWQKKKLQKLSVQELKESNMVWVPKGSNRTQGKDDVHKENATQLKEKRRSKRRSSNIRFASNHLNYWSVHHPFDSQMPHMPMSWNPSYNLFGYLSYFNFDPWVPYEPLYQVGLKSYYYAY